MKLSFDDISCGGTDFRIAEFCLSDKKDISAKAVVSAEIHARRIDPESVVFRGTINGKRTAICDRCGEQGEYDLQGEFIYRITTRQVDFSGQTEVECTDEDAQSLHLNEPEFDVDDLLREQVLLAIPLRTVCRDDCKGICAGCGAALNEEPCSCPSTNSNSPFAILGKLGKH